jgi:hypothetical protein
MLFQVYRVECCHSIKIYRYYFKQQGCQNTIKKVIQSHISDLNKKRVSLKWRCVPSVLSEFLFPATLHGQNKRKYLLVFGVKALNIFGNTIVTFPCQKYRCSVFTHKPLHYHHHQLFNNT